EAWGRYCPIDGSQQADIEIYFDWLDDLPGELRSSKLFLSYQIVHILMHEVYHHIVRGQRRLRQPKFKKEQSDADEWANLLGPAQESLLEALTVEFMDHSSGESDRVTAARILARFRPTDLLANLLLDADSAQFALLFQALEDQSDTVLAVATQTLTKRLDEFPVEQRIEMARRQRSAIAALMRLGRTDDALPLLQASTDPTTRTTAILTLREYGVTIEMLLRALETAQEPEVRQALWLAMAASGKQGISGGTQIVTTDLLRDRFVKATSQAERSALQWLLSQTAKDDAAASQQIDEADESGSSGRDYAVNTQGQVFRVFHRVEIRDSQAPAVERARDDDRGTPPTFRGNRPFAIGVREVTAREYLRFRPNATYDLRVCPDRDCPITFVSWLDAAAYCRWLSEQERIPEDQMCYPAIDQIRDGMKLPVDMLSRTGYRLPTEDEWEYACTAGSTTAWFCGEDEEQLSEFGWFVLNSRERCWPVASLRPNAFGLFDTLGNVYDWCHNPLENDSGNGPTGAVPTADGETVDGRDRAVRGGCYRSSAARSRSDWRDGYAPGDRYSLLGFRVARTAPDDWCRETADPQSLGTQKNLRDVRSTGTTAPPAKENPK
ncbi:MAG: formylglycine-generating enzyme family protein, partial [Planctomycetes bacterium]|nr:formylglycine-generating enzyme family protein [Planctomycetota bacterium]